MTKKKNNIVADEGDESPLYLIILKEELLKRTRNNSEYSLRAFAKQLGIDASLLSKIFKNSRSLSPLIAKKILEKINLSSSEKKIFWDSYTRSRNDFENTLQETAATIETHLEHDLFQIIAEPYHYGIMELLSIKEYQIDQNKIATKLKLSPQQFEAAVARLLALKMLEKNENGLVRSKERFTTKNKEISDNALIYHQRKVLEMASSALDQTSIDRRSQNSMTIAVNPQKIPVVKKMFEEFINQVSDVLETGEVKEVYQISFSLFPFSVSHNQEVES